MTLSAVKMQTLEQVREMAAELGMHHAALAGGIAAYNLLDQMPDELPEVKYARTPGRRPLPEENPYNAWYVKVEIQGAPSGKLAGKKIALKDNICLAGVPMMNG